MSNLIPFQFESTSIRVVTDEGGEPLFVAKDICEALGYKDPTTAVRNHCKGVPKLHPLQTPGGMQELRVLTEPDVLRLIVKSDLPGAERFEAWVFEDVLPAIRKTGSYTHPKVGAGRAALQPPRLFPDYFKVARLIGCDRNAAAISANQAVLQKTGENVLALLGQTHMEAEKQEIHFNVSDLVDGISGQRMNKMLAAEGLQTREGEQWVPTTDGKDFCRIFDTGKRHGSGAPITAIKWSKEVLDLLTLGEAA